MAEVSIARAGASTNASGDIHYANKLSPDLALGSWAFVRAGAAGLESID
jgi:hypothetical protein